MKIYTYYDNINFSDQEELIDLWKLSWSRRGFDPVVLSLSSAQSHPYYDEFINKIKHIVKYTTGKDCSPYGLSCWVRWMAYATQEEEKFYVSDYDAINLNFNPTTPNDKLHLMDDCCPFMASGTPSQFEKLCHMFVGVSMNRLDVLKGLVTVDHDQEFFAYNLQQQFNKNTNDLLNEYNILMTRNRMEIGNSFDPIKQKTFAVRGKVCDAKPTDIVYCDGNINAVKILHVSHTNVMMLKMLYSVYNDHDLNKTRVKIIEQSLGLK